MRYIENMKQGNYNTLCGLHTGSDECYGCNRDECSEWAYYNDEE